jgi:hypothetical protein
MFPFVIMSGTVAAAGDTAKARIVAHVESVAAILAVLIGVSF